MSTLPPPIPCNKVASSPKATNGLQNNNVKQSNSPSKSPNMFHPKSGGNYSQGVAKRASKHDASFSPCSFPISKTLAPCLKPRSEEHTSELQSRGHLVCRLLLEKRQTLHGLH